MKKAIIIGATSGIGKALARILVNNNFHVGIAGRRAFQLENLQEENNSQYFPIILDVKNVELIPPRLKEFADALNGIDLFIICAGSGELNPELLWDLEEDTITTNVKGFAACAGWAFNYFKHQGFGQIVGISSIAGLRGSKYAPAYNASKAFQINYLEGLRQKAKGLTLPIVITDIRPGFVETAMAKGEGQFWVATPEKAAKQIFSAINKQKNVAYVTKRWWIFAVLLKLVPRSIYVKM